MDSEHDGASFALSKHRLGKRPWAARNNIWLLIELTQKGVLSSFLFFSFLFFSFLFFSFLFFSFLFFSFLFFSFLFFSFLFFSWQEAEVVYVL